MKTKNDVSQGFVVVATRKENFIKSALNLRESIFDFWEDAKVTLFTEQKFIDKYQDDFKTFDKVIPVGDSIREKMLGMAQTPYDETFYIDADCEVAHEDIALVFDHLNDGSDLVFVELTEEGSRWFADWDWGNGPIDHLTHCGGVCLYRSSNPLVIDFMNDWYELYNKQSSGYWKPEQLKHLPEKWFKWDQTTLWYLVHHHPKYRDLKIKFFEDNYRWNFFTSFYNDPSIKTEKEPVVIHHSATMDKCGSKGLL